MGSDQQRPPRHVPPAWCPVCLGALNATKAVGGGDQRPAPGDVTICLYCSCIMEFDADLRPARMEPARLAALDPIHRATIHRIEQAVQRMRKDDDDAPELQH